MQAKKFPEAQAKFVSSVPEANPVIVLIPFVGAVLLVSSLQLLRRRSC